MNNSLDVSEIYKEVQLSTNEMKLSLKNFLVPDPNVLYIGDDPTILKSVRSKNAYSRLYQVKKGSKGREKNDAFKPVHTFGLLNLVMFPLNVSVANLVVSQDMDSFLLKTLVGKLAVSNLEHGSIFAFLGDFDFIKKLITITDQFEVRYVFTNSELYMALGVFTKNLPLKA